MAVKKSAKEKTVDIRDVYGYGYQVPQYAKALAYRYAARHETYSSDYIKYDDKYIYRQEDLHLEGKISDAIGDLHRFAAMGCTEISTTYYDVPYEDQTSTQMVVEDVPYPRYDDYGELTQEGKSLEKVLEAEKKYLEKAKAQKKEAEERQLAEARKLLEKKGFKVADG